MAPSNATWEFVQSLLESGLSQREVARRAGVAQGTVSRWSRLAEPPITLSRATRYARWEVRDKRAYCYLLGAYLGDGTVGHQPPGHWNVSIVNDRRYQTISAEILAAMKTIFPDATPRRWPSHLGASDILRVSHPAIPKAFPQHGPGRKHTRTIALADWQRTLTHAHPEALIRGLIHSDGCRSVNRFRTTLPSGRVGEYAYVRYFFTNHSADIRGIFTEHCELLGIRVTQPNHRNLAVSHRDSVAILERIVGVKR